MARVIVFHDKTADQDTCFAILKDLICYPNFFFRAIVHVVSNRKRYFITVPAT